jgi:hypothetical protein
MRTRWKEWMDGYAQHREMAVAGRHTVWARAGCIQRAAGVVTSRGHDAAFSRRSLFSATVRWQPSTSLVDSTSHPLQCMHRFIMRLGCYYDCDHCIHQAKLRDATALSFATSRNDCRFHDPTKHTRPCVIAATSPTWSGEAHASYTFLRAVPLPRSLRGCSHNGSGEAGEVDLGHSRVVALWHVQRDTLSCGRLSLGVMWETPRSHNTYTPATWITQDYAPSPSIPLSCTCARPCAWV